MWDLPLLRIRPPHGCFHEDGGRGLQGRGIAHRVHRVATSAFWRTFSDEGKIRPGWWGWEVHAHPLSLHLPSPLKLQCTLHLSGQIHWPCFISINMCTLWYSTTSRFNHSTMLPTGRFFGRITLKFPNKKNSGRTKLRPNFGRFCTEGAELDKKFVFLLFSIILCKSKKYYIFPGHVDTDNKIFISPPKCLQKFKFSKEPNFFLSGRIFRWTSQKVLPRVSNTVIV